MAMTITGSTWLDFLSSLFDMMVKGMQKSVKNVKGRPAARVRASWEEGQRESFNGPQKAREAETRNTKRKRRCKWATSGCF